MERRFLRGIAWTKDTGHEGQEDEPWWFPVIAQCRGQFFYYKFNNKYILSHENSGLIVTRFKTKKSCEECIMELGSVPFWDGNFPIDEGFQQGVIDTISQDHVRINRCF
jgi:hypothetical protein